MARASNSTNNVAFKLGVDWVAVVVSVGSSADQVVVAKDSNPIRVAMKLGQRNMFSGAVKSIVLAVSVHDRVLGMRWEYTCRCSGQLNPVLLIACSRQSTEGSGRQGPFL